MARLTLPALWLAATLAQAYGHYQVERPAGEGGALRVSLILPQDALPELRRFYARGVDWGLESQVREPQCEGGFRLEQDDYGYWLAPPGCRVISWRVDAPLRAEGSVSASAPASMALAAGDWTLLSEPTSLLRPIHGGPAAQTLHGATAQTPVLGASPGQSGGWQVPQASAGLELYLMGAARTERRQIGAFDVRHGADDLQRVQRLGLLDAHGKVLKYLAHVVYGAVPVPKDQRALLVVWLGLDAAHGPTGATAGGRSLLLNYPTGDQPHAAENLASSLASLAHGQFQQLAGARRGPHPALPDWVSESLAQYYGLRALDHVAPDKAAATRLSQRFIDPQREVTLPLPDVQPLFASDRPRALEMANRQGATFWAQLDRALRSTAADSHGLDAYIPALLQMDFAEDGRLPEAFLSQLHALEREPVDAVLSKYLSGEAQ